MPATPITSGAQDGKKRLCPFLDEPAPDCYCSRMDSQSIEAAIRFCSGEFEACEIYGRMKRERAPVSPGERG